MQLLLGKFKDKQPCCWFWQNLKTLNKTTSVIWLHNSFNCNLEVSVALTISHQQSKNLSQSSLMIPALDISSLCWWVLPLIGLWWGCRAVGWCRKCDLWPFGVILICLPSVGRANPYITWTKLKHTVQKRLEAVWMIGCCQLWIAWALFHLKPLWLSRAQHTKPCASLVF